MSTSTDEHDPLQNEACQRCASARLLFVQSHAQDMHVVQVGEREAHGYLSGDLGVGGGDDLMILLCLDCGQLQGAWPLPASELEAALAVE